ncbi:phage tail tape measure protein [Metabacillus bambusae]|uniref:Phage tail tape measure protein n=1 Tax=Metabacillus bambusae TaxID=2795218 RepID=A0ABS3N9U6_9BACI|nr:phage tail tape measure protein [Metabacillus bambusae]MBO1515057.1 phage tail tape measure protein [Metabacillus bambusae]
MQDLGALRARLLLEANNFKQGMQQAREEMKNTGFSARQASNDLQLIQNASLAVGAAVAAGIGSSVKVAVDFEAQMSRVKAISGATDEEFKKLEASALELGASTSKSASEVAIAFEDMAAKGFNANEIMAAMPGVIAAAEASGSDLALTADVVSSALNGFQLEASEASRIADILAKTANISAASMDDMGYAFKYVSPVANTLGISIEEVSAAIGIMTNAGIDGSSAGTALRAALLALNNPANEQEEIMKKLGFSMRDRNGEAKDLSEIFADLTEVTKDMTDAEKVATIAKLVGTEASSGMIAVMEGGVDQLNEFTDALENSSGASKDAADIMKDNLKGAFQEFQGALETLGIQVGNEFLPMFKEIIQTGTDVVEMIGELDPTTVKAGLAFAGTAAGIGLTVTSIGKLIVALRTLSLSMGPAGWLITGLSLIGGLVAGANIAYSDMNEVTLEHVDAAQKEIDSLSTMTARYDELKGKLNLTTDELGRFLDINDEITRTSDPKVIEKLKDEQIKLKKESGLTNAEFEEFLGLNDKIIEKVPESNVVLSEQGNIMLANSEAAKKLTEEKAKQLRIDLETEQANLESTLNENIKERKSLLEDINGLAEKRNTTEKELEAQTRVVGELESELQTAKASGDDEAIYKAEVIIGREHIKLQELREQHAANMDNIKAKNEELTKVDQQIGKLDKVKNSLIALELQQVGINAKKGQEIQQIDAAISKLEAEKKKLQEKVPVSQRNTQEYKNAVAAIDSQISNLSTVKSRVQEITGEASTMNSVLGVNIQKQVNITTTNRTRQIIERGYESATGPREMRHSGGTLPKLHVGGVPDWLTNVPNHNEIDVRLLRNEMVLTETQQANLFKMIDEGSFDKSGNSKAESTKSSGLNLGPLVFQTFLNRRLVAEEIVDDITDLQARKDKVENMFGGG